MTEDQNRILLEKAKLYLPGGRLTEVVLPLGLDFVASHGQGAYIYDVNGRKYIDYLINGGALILGHAHPSVVEAVKKNAPKGFSFMITNNRILELAEEIVKSVRCAEKIRFTASGMEACYYSLIAARTYTGREKVLKFEGGYHGHGDYFDISSVNSNSYDLKPHPEPAIESTGIPKSVHKTVLVAPFNDIEHVKCIIEKHKDDLACIIMEPVQRQIQPKEGFLQSVRKMASEHGIVLIFDEMVTGFRISYGGAQEHYGVVPDLTALGKIMTGGLPGGAIVGKADIMNLCADQGTKDGKEYRRWFQGGTFNGNPLMASAGLATLNEMKKNGTYNKLRKYGNDLRAGIKGVLEGFSIPVQVLGIGPLSDYLISEEQIDNYRDALRSNLKMKSLINKELLRRGVFFMDGASAKIYNSLSHGEEELKNTLRAFEDATKEARKSL